MIGKQGVSLLIGHNGIQDKTALNPANETVARGIYDATTLSAVDADLQVGNIKLAENIFGFVGTLAPGGTETIEREHNASIANGVNYTPAVSGIFFEGNDGADFNLEYFSTADGAWYTPGDVNLPYSANGIGDSTNFRIKNDSGAAEECCLMRHYISTGTYERARDEDLAANANWTPGNSGFFSTAGESTLVKIQLQYAVAGWRDMGFVGGGGKPISLPIGDGTNLRIKNNDGANARYHVTMRAVMT